MFKTLFFLLLTSALGFQLQCFVNSKINPNKSNNSLEKAFAILEKHVKNSQNPYAKKAFEDLKQDSGTEEYIEDMLGVTTTVQGKKVLKDSTTSKLFDNRYYQNLLNKTINDLKTCTDCIPESRRLLCLILFRDLIEK